MLYLRGVGGRRERACDRADVILRLEQAGHRFGLEVDVAVELLGGNRVPVRKPPTTLGGVLDFFDEFVALTLGHAVDDRHTDHVGRRDRLTRVLEFTDLGPRPVETFGYDVAGQPGPAPPFAEYSPDIAHPHRRVEAVRHRHHPSVGTTKALP